MKNETETQDYEAIEKEPTVQDKSQYPNKEFAEVNTRKIEKKKDCITLG